jgi:hypothetical protein
VPPGWHLEPGQFLPHEPAQLAGVGRLACAGGDDERDDLLAEDLVRGAHDRGLPDARVARDPALDRRSSQSARSARSNSSFSTSNIHALWRSGRLMVSTATFPCSW